VVGDRGVLRGVFPERQLVEGGVAVVVLAVGALDSRVDRQAKVDDCLAGWVVAELGVVDEVGGGWR